VENLRTDTYLTYLKKTVGIAMIKKKYWDKTISIELRIKEKSSKGRLCDLPIVS